MTRVLLALLLCLFLTDMVKRFDPKIRAYLTHASCVR